jgi:hypothetical protein
VSGSHGSGQHRLAQRARARDVRQGVFAFALAAAAVRLLWWPCTGVVRVPRPRWPGEPPRVQLAFEWVTR